MLCQSFILGRKYGFSSQNFLFVYLFVTFLIEGFSFIMDKINENIIIGLPYNLYLIFVLSFFYLYYADQLPAVFKTLSGLFLAVSLLYIGIFTEFLGSAFDENIAVAVMLFLIVHAVIWFYCKLNSADEESILDNPCFWISSGLLLWGTFGIFRCLPMYYFYHTDQEFSDFIKANFTGVNIIFYTLIFISLHKYEHISKRRIAGDC